MPLRHTLEVMRSTRVLAALCALVVALSGCSSSAKEAAVSQMQLGEVPYALVIDSTLAAPLTAGRVRGELGQQVRELGGTSATVYYSPASGNRSILMTVFLLPADRFDAAANPNEPPLFGQEVRREAGTVLSVAGPSDTIFEPTSDDGKHVIALNGLMYQASSYIRSKP